MSYTCPRCGATSHNPNDETYKYCARCHRFEDGRESHLCADDWAVIKANTKRWAAQPMPEDVRLRIARIWNSGNGGAKE